MVKINKKGVELSLQTIIIFIILLIVLFIIVVFFIQHYGSNSDSLINVGKDAIDSAKG